MKQSKQTFMILEDALELSRSMALIRDRLDAIELSISQDTLSLNGHEEYLIDAEKKIENRLDKIIAMMGIRRNAEKKSGE